MLAQRFPYNVWPTPCTYICLNPAFWTTHLAACVRRRASLGYEILQELPRAIFHTSLLGCSQAGLRIRLSLLLKVK
jgi:hypothetical protein